MASRDDIMQAIRNADAAGDSVSVRKLGAYLQTMGTPAPQTAPESTSWGSQALQQVGNLVGGAVRGAGSIGATLLTPVDAAARALGVQNGFIGRTDRRDAMDGSLRELGADTGSFAFGAGKLGSEIAGTAGVGGMLASGARAVPMLAARAPALLDAIGSAGMKAGSLADGAGLSAQLANVGVRAAGGAITGAASAGLVNPGDAGTSAAIGAALPPVLKTLGVIGGAVGRGVQAVRTPEAARLAKSIMDAGGYQTPEAVGQVRQLLQQQGPDILGETATVPQLLQNPLISQLQRSLRNAGETTLLTREAEQNTQRLAGLDRIAKVTGTVQDAADNFGRQLEQWALPAEKQAGRKVTAAYEAVDPFEETAFHLPISDLQAAQSKYLGLGTFGTGSKAAQAISTAQAIGQQELPAVAPLARATADNSQTLEKAVRSAGGIRTPQGLTGEYGDLGIKGSGTTGLVNNKSGQSADILAQAMHERGFIPDADPATLLAALRNGGGRKLFANDQVENNAMQRMSEAAMGDAPEATVMAKPVPFQQLQNLRSSMGEAAESAAAKGSNKEAAALRTMIGSLDSHANEVAAGNGAAGEYFPADIVSQWRQANALHAAKMDQFHTGPQVAMFRNGSDGLPSAQGGELARKFFNSGASQTADMAAFHRLTDGQLGPDLLKQYAVTGAADQTDKAGKLLNSKFTNWMDARSGSLAGLLGPQDQAVMQGVRNSLQRSDAASDLGKALGSNTAQNAQSALGLGLLDNASLKAFATGTPGLKYAAGPMLDMLRNSALKGRVNGLSGLLADPQALDHALGLLGAVSPPVSLSGPLSTGLLSGVYRASPQIGHGQ